MLSKQHTIDDFLRDGCGRCDSARQQFVSLSFFKGVLLKDPQSLLITQGEHSHIARIFNIDNTELLHSHQQQLTSWIAESKLAITTKPPLPKRAQLDYPTELDAIFLTDPHYKKAFAKLTPGRQRGYLIHFSSGKKSSTRSSRIQKCRAKIMDGKGWNER